MDEHEFLFGFIRLEVDLLEQVDFDLVEELLHLSVVAL